MNLTFYAKVVWESSIEREWFNGRAQV